uniref:Carbohydrate sulfotransferase 10 n=1 Tax=Mus musculus TaxID=10090 RepID=A0A0A6YWB7_MOUSE
MHHQWLLLAACFWVIFMFMVASKFITLTFKDPDGAFKEYLPSGLWLRQCHCAGHGCDVA